MVRDLATDAIYDHRGPGASTGAVTRGRAASPRAGDWAGRHGVTTPAAELLAGAMLAAAMLACGGSTSTEPPDPGGQLRWELATPGGLPLSAVRDAQGRPYLYLALKQGGVAVLHLDGASPPTEVARVHTTALGGLDAMTMVQRGTRLYVGLGDLFAAQGSKAGLAVIDVQAPEQPQVVARWISPSVLHGSAAVLVDGDNAFLGAMRDGVFVFDVSQPDTARLVTTIVPDPDFPTPNPTAVQYPNARGLAIVGNLLYVADDAGGLRVIDVSNRGAPHEVGKYVNSAITGKQQAYNSVAVSNGTAYVAVDYCGLEILDVSNAAAITQRGWWNPWGCETSANTWFNSPGHTNQLILDASRHLAYLSAGASQLQVVDVADPSHPVPRGEFRSTSANQGAWGIANATDETYVLYITAFVPFVGTWTGIRSVTPIR